LTNNEQQYYNSIVDMVIRAKLNIISIHNKIIHESEGGEM